MNHYKIVKGYTAITIKAASLDSAESIGVATFIDGFTVEDLGAVPTKPARQKIKERKAFGASLEDDFMYDNAVYFATRGTPITKAEARFLKTKCKDVWDMASVGSLEICIEELQDITPDAIITQVRLNKYIAAIQAYITNE